MRKPPATNPPKREDDPNVNVLGKAARRAADAMAAVIFTSAATPWLQQAIPASESVQGLHWCCGSGEGTFGLSSLLTKNSSLHAIDEDRVLIKAAVQQKALREWQAVQFAHASLNAWHPDLSYDFIYSCPRSRALSKTNEWLPALHRLLKDDGVLMLAIVQPAGWQAFPYNFAFAYAVELLSHLAEDRPGPAHWPERLKMQGFSSIETDYASPAFIPRAGHPIISLSLESSREELIHRRLTNREEVNALLQELRAFEQRDDTLISRPGLFQLLAKKNPPDT